MSTFPAVPCQVCSAPTRERGNCQANFCHLCDPVRKLGEKALAIVLRVRKDMLGLSLDDEVSVNGRLSMRALVYWDVLDEAKLLGLLDGGEVKP